MNIPNQAEIIEVCSRDGFQNIKTPVSTPEKIAIIDQLAACGFSWMEATSFVHPKAVPQMADAAEVLRAVKKTHGDRVKFIALAPNLYGAERALEAGADALTFVISASEQHNQANTRQTIARSLGALAEVCRIKAGRKVRLAVATAFECPFAGTVAPEEALRLVESGLAAGADEVVLADTIGTASPCQVEALLSRLAEKYPQVDPVLHLHDTQGMGLANVLTALQLGVSRFEAAAFGLGGCPFAPGAAGNIASEDLVNMLHKLGAATGINAARLTAAARFIGSSLGLPALGHMARVAACREDHHEQ